MTVGTKFKALKKKEKKNNNIFIGRMLLPPPQSNKQNKTPIPKTKPKFDTPQKKTISMKEKGTLSA